MRVYYQGGSSTLLSSFCTLRSSRPTGRLVVPCASLLVDAPPASFNLSGIRAATCTLVAEQYPELLDLVEAGWYTFVVWLFVQLPFDAFCCGSTVIGRMASLDL